MQTKEVQVGPGAVNRNHFVQSAVLQTSAGESQMINEALPDAFLGILVPSAPDVQRPGQLEAGANVMGPVPTPIALREDRGQTSVLNELFPPPPGARWAAMVISDTQQLAQFFAGPVDMDNLGLYLSYGIDFGGADPCNGCEVKLTGCVPAKFSAFLPAGVTAARTSRAPGDQDTVCTQPVSTFITLVDPFNNFEPLPGAPVVAAFGLYGSQPATGTVNGLLDLPVNLEHTSPTTLTFDLAPIQSARGWTYHWASLQGAPISQIAIPGPYQPYYIKPVEPDMKVVASGLPTCTQIVDVLTLQATDTVSPEIHAETQAYIQVLPDPALCPVADVAAFHVQATDVVSGSDRMTYTLTISNLESVAVAGIITQTLTPANAVRGAELPAGCSIAANVITCLIDNVPAQGSAAVNVVVLGRGGYSGQLVSIEQTNPGAAADRNYLDNVHGRLVANVVFAIAPQPLTVAKAGNGSGLVTSTPAGIDCGSDCTESFVGGTVVTLTAAADAGSTFVDWEGACTGSDPVCPVTMDAAKAVTATFALNNYPLTVTKAGNGSGLVTSTPAGIDCGGDCAEIYLHGTVVTLTAAADAGSTFVDWQGACTGSSPVCPVTMDAARAVTATFILNSYPLTVAKAGNGSGLVTSVPAGIDCGGACAETYLHGTVVTLTATADAGSTFVDWQGACTGSDPLCPVTMDAAKAVTATFILNSYPLTVTKAGNGSGVVASVPAGIDCGGDCAESFVGGTVVTLTATADAGSTFVDWQGACTGSNPVCPVTMDAARAVTATFILNSYPLTVTKAGNGSGLVASIPAGIDCGSDCAETYLHGTVVTLTATADAGSTFVDWQGACTGVAAVCQVTMNGARAINAARLVTATFVLAPQGTITITKIAENGNATFSFVSQALGDFALTTVGGTASRTFSGLAAGAYDVVESPPAGWQASTTSCSDGSDPASINLAQGEAVTCTFTSRPSPTDLPAGEEPALSLRQYLPMINR